MKLFKQLFLAFAAVLLAVGFSACSSDDDEELTSFYSVDSTNFNNQIDALKAAGSNYVIVDCRPAAQYSAGHIKGAINLEATATNTASNTASFATTLLADYPGYYIMLYGCVNVNSYVVAGRVSKCGYGKAKTYSLLNTYAQYAASCSDRVE